MKNYFLSFSMLSIIFGAINSYSQTTDSLELEIQKKQLEIMKQELEMKKQELEMKSEEYKNQKEDRQERKTEEKEQKQEQKKEKEELKSYMESNTNIFLNPLPLFVGGFEVGIEKRTGLKQSVRFTGGYYYNESVWYYRNGSEMEGGKLNLQYRFYLRDDKPGMFGLYVGPDVTFKTISYNKAVTSIEYDTIYDPPYYYVNYTESTKDSVITAMAGSVGLVCGVQGILFRRLTVDFHFGANLLIPLKGYDNDDVSLPLVNPYGRGSHPKISFSIGVPF